jgi:hypothetical protein
MVARVWAVSGGGGVGVVKCNFVSNMIVMCWTGTDQAWELPIDGSSAVTYVHFEDRGSTGLL